MFIFTGIHRPLLTPTCIKLNCANLNYNLLTWVMGLLVRILSIVFELHLLFMVWGY